MESLRGFEEFYIASINKSKQEEELFMLERRGVRLEDRQAVDESLASTKELKIVNGRAFASSHD